MMSGTNETNKKLLAVFLGGRAARCNIELHDVVFIAGQSIKTSYHKLMDKWFGDPFQLHIDSWLDLEIVDGYRIMLRPNPPLTGKKLYFINLGAYLPGQFNEIHANTFIVAANRAEVKQRAKAELLTGAQSIHTDDLYEIDDCLELAEIDGEHIHLEPTTEEIKLKPQNGYHVIPPEILAAYRK